jgi:DNA sulfur modification protein DndD
MFIKRIILEDFRIYRDRQELEFVENDTKNVFIISGNNGFGKTTLLNSLVWCLYGKLMIDVDDKFRKEIYEAGGYKKYAFNNLNKKAFAEGKSNYKVSLLISDIFIPSIPCKEVKITRSFDISKLDDHVEILIDGMENELTKEVGHEIFIHDFILPKEIAKFFFFDAEKIVSLAEMKSTDEKKSLSKAYSEVLGIKKYEDLKSNLEDLRIRFRRNSATEKDSQKLVELQKEASQLKELVLEYEDQILVLNEEKRSKKQLSEQYQEKLIREGSSITLDELTDLKKLKVQLSDEAELLRNRLKELLELAPFAIAGNKFTLVRTQLLEEIEHAQSSLNPEIINKKIKGITKDLSGVFKTLNIGASVSRQITSSIESAIFKYFHTATDSKEFKVLLDFTESEQYEFEAIYNNLKYSFKESFRNITNEYNNNRIAFNRVVKKLSNAESKEDDLLVKEIRHQKALLENRIDEIDKRIMELSQEIGGLHKEIVIKSKLISELSKKVELKNNDQAKDETVQRLVSHLEKFIKELKLEKKSSLEQRLKVELNSLMHKKSFINRVQVDVDNEMIDIHLFDRKDNLISKDTLSKGEQQLYATALLKSLVDESNILFPIFIDSPLQKFDKSHSRTIIRDFYPKISEQVVLFPLLEKELTEQEYTALLPKVNKTYLIEHASEYCSCFKETEPKQLFERVKVLYENIYQY